MILRLPRRPKIARPINLPELFKSLAFVLLGASSLIAVIVVNDAKGEEQERANSLADQLEESQSTSTCRSKLASDVTDATTTYLFAMGQSLKANGSLVVAIANGDTLVGPLKAIDESTGHLDVAGLNLDYRRDRRVAFEENPSTECPDPAPAVLDPTTTTTTAAGEASTIATRRTTTSRAPVATTARSPSSTSPPSTTTSRPTPLCDLLPAPLTVPPEVPCL